MQTMKKQTSNIFEFTDYRSYLQHWLGASGERGQLARLSEVSGVHKTTLSQVLKGDKDFSLEQAEKVGDFLGHNPSELEYFILLVNYARAGTKTLQQLFLKQIKKVQDDRKSLTNRVTKSRELSVEERSIYYSNWMYSAVRNTSAIPGLHSRMAIADRLRIELKVCNQIVDFLLSTGLCVESNGEIKPGPAMTHLGASSPLVSRHHGNWRVKAMDRHPSIQPHELAYTAPMTLSAEDVGKIRDLLSDLVEKTDQIVTDSPSEKLYCMNLDWFEVR